MYYSAKFTLRIYKFPSASFPRKMYSSVGCRPKPFHGMTASSFPLRCDSRCLPLVTSSRYHGGIFLGNLRSLNIVQCLLYFSSIMHYVDCASVLKGIVQSF